MRNKAKISKAILAAKSGQRVTALKAKLHHVEDQLKNSYDIQKEIKLNQIKSRILLFLCKEVFKTKVSNWTITQ